jgi:hypothetical protein
VRSGPDSSTRSFHVSLSWFISPRLWGEPLRTPASYQRRRDKDKCVRAASLPRRCDMDRHVTALSKDSEGATRTGAL